MLLRKFSMKEIAHILKALSDETRLRIVKLLQARELCVCELIQVLDMSQPRISRHLSILKNAGLVNDRREGKWVHYSLTNGNGNNLNQIILKTMAVIGNDALTVQNDQENLNKAVKLSKIECACNRRHNI